MKIEIGVFCGTFNPIHWGHLLMAESAREQAKLEKVLFITSPNPPHRKTDLLDAELRHELVVAACQDNNNFEPSRMELDRAGPSYTVETLETLATQYPENVRLNLIIGEDNLPFLGQWKGADHIFKVCRILVAPRVKQPVHVGAPTEEKRPPADADIQRLEIPQMPVSSSEIRKRLREGRSVLYMVPMPVDKILHEKGLYL